MPTITFIKPQKNNKRVNIYLDNKFGFGLDLENYVLLGLKVEQELTKAEIDEIVKKAEYAKALNKILKFATLRPRSEYELSQWLNRKQVSPFLHKKLFSKLYKLSLVDDEKFAQWWVTQRQEFRPKSKRILSNELRIKGINKHLIDKILKETEIDEQSIAKSLIEKNAHRWQKYDEFARKHKMSAFLARQGFSWEVVKKVVNE